MHRLTCGELTTEHLHRPAWLACVGLVVFNATLTGMTTALESAGIQ